MYTLKYIVVWVLTICISAAICVTVGVGIVYLLHSTPIVEQIPRIESNTYTVGTGVLVSIRGDDIRSNYQSLLEFFYGRSENDAKIAEGVAKQFFFDLISQGNDITSFLDAFSGIPYALVVRTVPPEKTGISLKESPLHWALAFAGAKEFINLERMLHEGIRQSYEYGVIRVHEFPSGKTYREVRKNDAIPDTREWLEGNFVIRSTVSPNGSVLHSVYRDQLLLLGNDLPLQLSLVDFRKEPSLRHVHVAASIFTRIADYLPNSDTLAFLHQTLGLGEPFLSLSSWRCMP